MGDKSGVIALLKQENSAVVGVHAIAHVVELAWADAIKDRKLIKRMLATNQKAYVHYGGSAKKRLTFKACCRALGEADGELVTMHGIRWRESSHRSTVNLINTWRARCTDLLEEASIEVGLKLTPLSAPELFLGMKFRLKTDDRREPFKLIVKQYLGEQGGEQKFKCIYQTRGKEEETFSKQNILACLLDDSNQKEALHATDAGQLLLELTDYGYVKTLFFWADITSQGKVLSKIFQRDNVLLSDITSGVEDSEHAVGKLATTPGRWMCAFTKDYDAARLALDGIELHSAQGGETDYQTELAECCKNVTNCLNQRFCSLLSNPVLKAAVVFEHARWPDFATARTTLEDFGSDKVTVLVENYSTLLHHLGCNTNCVLDEWHRLKIKISREENLHSLPYTTLWERMFDQFSEKQNPQHFYNILLVVAIVHCFAIDTSICERGFSLMNKLKTAARSKMGNALLRMLMVISLLGAEWKHPANIPVCKIIDLWREESKKGRYEGELWASHMLSVP